MLNDVDPRNKVVGCWELSSNVSLHVQLFEHLPLIFYEPRE